MRTTASRGFSASRRSRRSSPESRPSFRSTRATSNDCPSAFRNAEAADSASSTSCPIASRATRRVVRMFTSSSAIKIRMNATRGEFRLRPPQRILPERRNPCAREEFPAGRAPISASRNFSPSREGAGGGSPRRKREWILPRPGPKPLDERWATRPRPLGRLQAGWAVDGGEQPGETCGNRPRFFSQGLSPGRALI